MRKGKISVLSVISMGIGSMVGAGIFSLMGQASLTAGNYVSLSFILGGAIALLSGLSYGKLGATYPEEGGILTYYNKAFGQGVCSGGLGLLYLATLAITVSMVAQAFGAYGKALLGAIGITSIPAYALTGAILLLLAFLNMLRAGIIGKAETWLVAVKLSLLLLLVAAGLPGLSHMSAPWETPPDLPGLAHSAGITFFAYAGYGMMANAAPDLAAPHQQLPRAITAAILAVATLYVLLSLVITNQISPQELAERPDTAVAEAAAPVLGQAGYIGVSIAALAATASAINATLFSMIRITDTLGKKAEIPPIFTLRLYRNGSLSYFLILLLCLPAALLFNLSETASLASGTFLVCYLSVFAAHWTLRHETGTAGWKIIPGFLLMLSIFLGFITSLLHTAPRIPLAFLGLILFAFLLEWGVQKCVKSRKHRHGAPSTKRPPTS